MTMAFFQENHENPILTVMERMATPTKTHPSKLPGKYVSLVEKRGKTKKKIVTIMYYTRQREHDQMQCGKVN